MTDRTAGEINRRGFGRIALGAAMGAAAFAFGGVAYPQTADPLRDFVPDDQDQPRLMRRVSGSISRNWQDSFSSLGQDAILADINDRTLHYWGSDGFTAFIRSRCQ